MKNELGTACLQQEIAVRLPLGALLRLAEAQPAAAVAPSAWLRDLPTIGAEWQGGIYAGLSVENERPAALVLMPGDESMTWSDAVAWAEKQGGTLPSRIDQLVLFKNLKSAFKQEWYWSGEQCAGGSGYAWCQGFGNGGQDHGRKGGHCRARAVRRVPIQ